MKGTGAGTSGQTGLMWLRCAMQPETSLLLSVPAVSPAPWDGGQQRAELCLPVSPASGGTKQ